MKLTFYSDILFHYSFMIPYQLLQQNLPCQSRMNSTKPDAQWSEIEEKVSTHATGNLKMCIFIEHHIMTLVSKLDNSRSFLQLFQIRKRNHKNEIHPILEKRKRVVEEEEEVIL